MYLLLVFLPFFSSILSLSFGFFLGKRGLTVLIITCSFVLALISFFIFYEVALLNSTCYIELYDFFNLGYLNLKIAFLFDTLTVIMLVIICFISFIVHLYSMEYMEHDICFNRFFAYLSLFTFFMIILVTSDNFIQMFIGWEGVGLSSYLLINF
jgi:NADH:ubiquinone oxidoreductase subunit 5 (subunit L)/multisubunit Na+/H+ antiporter MnhA subunit